MLIFKCNPGNENNNWTYAASKISIFFILHVTAGLFCSIETFFLSLHLHVHRYYQPWCRAKLACLHLQPHMYRYYYYYVSAPDPTEHAQVGTDHGNCPWGGSHAVGWWMSEKGRWCSILAIPSLLANSLDHFNFSSLTKTNMPSLTPRGLGFS